MFDNQHFSLGYCRLETCRSHRNVIPQIHTSASAEVQKNSMQNYYLKTIKAKRSQALLFYSYSMGTMHNGNDLFNILV